MLFCFYFETGSNYVGQAGLKLQSFCLSILSAGFTGMQNYAWLSTAPKGN
jgi:hypothetical protein